MLKIKLFNRFYAEVLFKHFDANNNGTLQLDEATKALRFLVKPTEGQPEPVLALPADYSRDGELHLPWSWFASVYKSME